MIYIVLMGVYIVISWISLNKFSPYLLLIFGLAFIFINAPLSGIILLSETLICYYFSKMKYKNKGLLISISILFIFLAFLLFKYLASNRNILLPLGISYFTFRLIHYLQESYRNRLREHTLLEFLTYMTFFPTYVVGPINLFPDFLSNLRRKKWDSSMFSLGAERILLGYAQLIILGNFAVNYLLKNWIDTTFQDASSFNKLIIHSIHLWIDLYIRFSAYSSIAIGLAQLSGFSVPENFNFPFLATNIRNFWQRWHMSLTNWCRDYIFIPVAAITRKPYLAIGATMITIGIWHELSFRYILWGIYHTIGILIFEKYSIWSKKIYPENKFFAFFRKIIGISITLAFVIMSFPITTVTINFINKIFK